MVEIWHMGMLNIEEPGDHKWVLRSLLRSPICTWIFLGHT